MPSFPFKDLPTEMRKKIVLHALPCVTVPFRYLHSNIARVHDHHEEQAFKALQESTSEIASLSNQIRCLEAIRDNGTLIMSSIGGVPFRMDPIHDTFQAVDMRLPAVRPSESWNPENVPGQHRHALPVENVLGVSRTVWLPRGQAPPEDDHSDSSSHVSDEAGPSDAPPPATYYDMPLEKNLPIFSRLPKVKNLALIIENAGREWSIEGFQMFGPDVIAGEYKQTHGHNGTFQNGWDYLSSPEDASEYPPTDSRFSLPNIGFYGYSRGNVSIGGHWAGFRLWLAEKKVEFSPLSWWEVEPLIGDYFSIEERGYHTCHPGFVARVWVIRSEKDLAPNQRPHHHWEEVREAEIGDPASVEQISTTWKMVRDMLSRVRGAVSIEDDNDLNLADGNYAFQMEHV
ncbi:uncharacterized protein FFB14_03080 [Fusarium fujikuroi]|nr:uncharacterized protein FFB14_03080 [Fusarium fujikuroi]